MRTLHYTVEVTIYVDLPFYLAGISADDAFTTPITSNTKSVLNWIDY